MKGLSLLVLSGSLVLIIDQAFKFFVFKQYFSYNKALFFGIITNPFLIGFILIGALFFLSFFAYVHLEKAIAMIGIGLIFGGALSNLIDRLFVGAVIDYIALFWGISKTNLADIAIIGGIAIIGREYLR